MPPPATRAHGEPSTAALRAGAASAGFFAAASIAACGGGAPLLHGAHTLGSGATSLGAGLSGTFATGEARSALRAARETPSGGSSMQRSQATEGRAIDAAMAPAVAPWAAVRVGLPAANEAGLTWNARSLRLDGRHAFDLGDLALSVGAGGNVFLTRLSSASDAFTSPPPTSGFGFDVPAIIGWRSAAGVVMLWGGARGGFDRIFADATATPPEGATAPPATPGFRLDRWYGGAVVGFAMGFRHLHGAFELDASYQVVRGSFDGQDVRASGVALTPAAALVASF